MIIANDNAAIAAANIQVFRQDITDLFNRVKGGHASAHEYIKRDRGRFFPTGDVLWGNVVKNDKYYLPKEEIELIKQHAARTLAERFHGADTLVDFGCGNEVAFREKILPIIKGVKSIKIYCPIDRSTDLLVKVLRQARANSNVKVPPLQVDGINGDFNTGKTQTGDNIILPGEKRAGFMLGSTITNVEMDIGKEFPLKAIVDSIRNPAQLLGPKGKGHSLTFGYDANSDLKNALTAYNHRAWELLVIGVMLDVKNFLKPDGDFDGSAWKYVPIIDEKNYVIHQCVQATRRQNFSIGKESFSIKPDDQFVINNNFKFQPGMFREFIQEAGGTPHKTLRHPNDRMVLQTMEYQ